jgi:hypothetical protein
LFLDAAFLLEVALQPFDEANNQNITLVNQRDGDIGNRLITTLPYLLTVDG